MTSDDAVEASKDIAAQAKSTADRAQRGLSDVAATVTSQVSDAAGKVSDATSGAYHRVRESASDIADKLPGNAGEAVDAGRRAYAQGNDKLARQIGRQPIEALLLAGAIGYLVGWAANRS